MIDTLLRSRLLPHLDSIGARTAQGGLTANRLTLIGFAVGIAGCFAVGMKAYLAGLVLLLINRFLCALAGSIARQKGVTDFGTMLDLLCSYLVFAGFAFFFSLSALETILASTLLIFAFLATGMTYLAHGWINVRKNIADLPQGGLVENGEMIVFFILCCVLPGYYAAFAALFALLCWVTAAMRFAALFKTAKS